MTPVGLTALVTALAGCGATSDRIDCRTGRAREYARACTIETGQSDAGRTITLRKPDGGFRRLLATREGLVAADGAEPVQVVSAGEGWVEVAIGNDAFRLPASVQHR